MVYPELGVPFLPSVAIIIVDLVLCGLRPVHVLFWVTVDKDISVLTFNSEEYSISSFDIVTFLNLLVTKDISGKSKNKQYHKIELLKKFIKILY